MIWLAIGFGLFALSLTGMLWLISNTRKAIRRRELRMYPEHKGQRRLP